MKSKTTKKDLAPLAKFVNENYDGNLLSLSSWIDRAIYMFHFIPEEQGLTENQRQNTCHVLMQIKECLLESYFKQNGARFDQMD